MSVKMGKIGISRTNGSSRNSVSLQGTTEEQQLFERSRDAGNGADSTGGSGNFSFSDNGTNYFRDIYEIEIDRELNQSAFLALQK